LLESGKETKRQGRGATSTGKDTKVSGDERCNLADLPLPVSAEVLDSRHVKVVRTLPGWASDGCEGSSTLMLE
jgi:hypothetical protein